MHIKPSSVFFPLVLVGFVAVALIGCPDDKEPAGFDCNCGAGEVCQDGRCVPSGSADAGADFGGDIVNNPDCPSTGVAINEFTYTPAEGAAEFIEIRGPVGTDLTGFRVIGVNGSNASEFLNVPLAGVIGDDGLFTVAAAPLEGADQVTDFTVQNGPDSLVLRDCGGQPIDAVGYGSFDAEEVFAGEGMSTPTISAGESLGRCVDAEDSDDNSADFHVIATPSPGTANIDELFENPAACVPCVEGALTGLVINEVLYDPEGTDELTTEFVELLGTPNFDLLGAELQLINGTNGEPYEQMPLSGSTDENGYYLVGGLGGMDPLGGNLQQGPDGVQIVDCAGVVVDAVGYGTFDIGLELGEGTPAPDTAQGTSLSRCPGATDSDNNAADFKEAAPTPLAENANFTDPLSCGGSCLEGLLDGRLWVSEIQPGTGGFVEFAGEPSIGLVDVVALVFDGAGTEVAVLDLPADTGSTGRFVISSDSVPAEGGSVVLQDCLMATLDAVAWGTGEALMGEGTAAAGTGAGESLARCEGANDTGNNATDFHISTAPTSGAANDGFSDPEACGPISAGCDAGVINGNVVINEVRYNPADGEFVELLGPPGAGVDDVLVQLVNGNGGTVYSTATLLGRFDNDGYYVVGDVGSVNFSGDIQNGPDGIRVISCDAETELDRMGYGALGEDMAALYEGSPASVVSGENSLSRCPGGVDSGDNGADFHEATATIGADNEGFSNPVACTECPTSIVGAVIINEVEADEPGNEGDSDAAFVELRGTPATDLTGSSVEHRDGGDGAVLATYFLGGAMPEDGYYVVGGADVANVDDTEVEMNLQNGPDYVVLLDCDGVVVDTVAYGDFSGLTFMGEGTFGADDDTGTNTISRFATETFSAADTNDNAMDFCLADPTPGEVNLLTGAPGTACP